MTKTFLLKVRFLYWLTKYLPGFCPAHVEYTGDLGICKYCRRVF